MDELLVTGLASGGEGVARLMDGRVVFIRGAVPGDTVTLKVTQDKARVVFADIAKLVTASPKRTQAYDPRIAASSVPWLGLDYQTQLDAKADNVVQAVTRIAKLTPRFRGITGATDELHYRHRARLHGRRGKLGYFARGTHDLIDRSSAPVCWPELDAALDELEAWIDGRGVRQVEVVYSRRDGKAAARIEAESAFKMDGAPFWVTRTDTMSEEVDATSDDVGFDGQQLRYDHAGAFDLFFAPGVFTQAHPAMNEKLVSAVLSAVEGKRVLELHAGIGNFSLPLALDEHAVRAVELNVAASGFCRRSAGSVAIECIAASDATALKDADAFDCVLMDPPRAGAREACVKLAERGPKQIVYVSCDPATLARDIATLVGGGYALLSLEAFDMFPQTPHVESLAVLVRA